MITVRMGAYEKGDFIRILDYAKEKKIEDCNKGIITPKLLELELKKIYTLKDRINGKYTEDYIRPSKEYIRQFPRQKDDLPKAYFKDTLI